MPVISITTWPTWSNDVKRALLEQITRVTHATTGAPLDKIVVVVNEVPQTAWMEGGVLGSDPTFPVASRRKTYTEGGPAKPEERSA
jgi:4-oxalocrotonate tautomerase